MPRFLIQSGAADNDFCWAVIAPTRKDAFAKVSTLCEGCREGSRDERSYRCMMCGGEYYAVRIRKQHVQRRIREKRESVYQWLTERGYYQDKDGSIRTIPKQGSNGAGELPETGE